MKLLFLNEFKIIDEVKESKVPTLDACNYKYAPLKSLETKIPEELKHRFKTLESLLLPNFKYNSMDFKIQFLKANTYPCSPIWHVDGAINYDKNKSDRYCLIIDSASCQTEFIKGPLEVSVPNNFFTKSKPDQVLIVNEQVLQYRGETFSLEPGQIIEYGNNTLHRGVVSQHTHQRVLMRLNQSNFIKPKHWRIL